MNISGGEEIHQTEVSGRHLQKVLTTKVSTLPVAKFCLKLTVVWGRTVQGSPRNAPTQATARVAHAFGARGYLEAQMMGGLEQAYPSTHVVLPGDHALAQHQRIYAQALANGFEAEGVAAAAIRHNPSLGIHVQHPLASAPRKGSLLVHVDGVRQQRQHQALFSGQPMAARKIVVLTWENLVQPDDAV